MERRRYPRRIVDRPASGAKLTFGWKGWLPRGFDLQDAFIGVRRAAQIVWSGVNGIGVRFTRVKPVAYRRIGFGRRQR
jgi:hypothetical protein